MLSESKLHELARLFKRAPTFQWRPPCNSGQAWKKLVVDELNMGCNWVNIDIAEKYNLDTDCNICVRADIIGELQKLLIRHPAVMEPMEIYTNNERLHGDIMSSDLAISIDAAYRDIDKDVRVMFLNVWSDGTTVGGNDRTGIKTWQIEIANHDSSFLKTDAARITIAIAGEGPGEIRKGKTLSS